MFTRGLLAALIVSLGWSLLLLLAMRLRPAQNRFNAMLLAWALSLPMVYIVFRWAPLPADNQTAGPEYVGLGLFHAYFLHLMLFFLHVEMFYHVERSVTLRFLVTLLLSPGHAASIAEVQKDYSLEHMIASRLSVLAQNGFVEEKDGRWLNRWKGKVIVTVMRLTTALFHSKPQSERL